VNAHAPQFQSTFFTGLAGDALTGSPARAIAI